MKLVNDKGFELGLDDTYDINLIKSHIDNNNHGEIDNYLESIHGSEYFPDGGFLDDLYNTGKSIAKSAVNDINEIVDDTYDVVKSTIDNTVNDIYDTTHDIYNDVNKNVDDVINDSKQYVSDLYGKDITNNKNNNAVVKNPIYDFNKDDTVKFPITESEIGVDRSKYTFDNIDKLPTKCNDKECTSYITNNALTANGGGFVDKFNYRGNGWTMFNNIENAGGEKIASIYDYDKDKPISYNENEMKSYIEKNINNTTYIDKLKSELKEGDYVSLYYPNSNHFQDAFNDTNGKTLTTHGGEIIKINNELYVRDNVSGNLHYRKLSSVFNNNEKDGVMIAEAISPSKKIASRDLTSVGISKNPDTNARFDRIHSENAGRAMASIIKNKKAILNENDIPEEEFNFLKPIAHAIMFKESIYGAKENNSEYNFTSGKSYLGKIARETSKIAESIGLRDAESVGLGNVKLRDRYSDEELERKGYLEYLDNDNQDILESPEFSGVITMEALIQNNKELNNILKEYPEIKNNEEIMESLLLTSYNQGFDNIKKNIEKYKETGDMSELTQYLKFDYQDSLKTIMSYSKYN